MRILLVEDEEAVRNLACRVLRRSGYNVLVARHGREALAMARRYTSPIDLVVTDLVMPHIGGRDVADALSRREPPPRILLISGYTPDALPGGIRTGGYPYLQKPFTPDVLTRRVREILDADRG